MDPIPTAKLRQRILNVLQRETAATPAAVFAADADKQHASDDWFWLRAHLAGKLPPIADSWQSAVSYFQLNGGADAPKPPTAKTGEMAAVWEMLAAMQMFSPMSPNENETLEKLAHGSYACRQEAYKKKAARIMRAISGVLAASGWTDKSNWLSVIMEAMPLNPNQALSCAITNNGFLFDDADRRRDAWGNFQQMREEKLDGETRLLWRSLAWDKNGKILTLVAGPHGDRGNWQELMEAHMKWPPDKPIESASAVFTFDDDGNASAKIKTPYGSILGNDMGLALIIDDVVGITNCEQLDMKGGGERLRQLVMAATIMRTGKSMGAQSNTLRFPPESMKNFVPRIFFNSAPVRFRRSGDAARRDIVFEAIRAQQTEPWVFEFDDSWKDFGKILDQYDQWGKVDAEELKSARATAPKKHPALSLRFWGE